MGLKEELAALCAEGDVRERLVEAAALIAEALRQGGIDPILVGGGAAQFHTAGAYLSGDIDFVAAGDPRRVLEELGFKKKGRYFVQPAVGLWVEFPSSHLDPGETAIAVEIGGRRLMILSAPDLLLDRLNAFKWGGSEADGVNALLLLRLHPGVDKAEIRERAARDRVLDALEGLKAEVASADMPDIIVARVREKLRKP